MGTIRKLGRHVRGAELRLGRALVSHLGVSPGQYVYLTQEADRTIRIWPLDQVPREWLRSTDRMLSPQARPALYAELNRRLALPPREPRGSEQNFERTATVARWRHFLRWTLDTLARRPIIGR